VKHAHAQAINEVTTEMFEIAKSKGWHDTDQPFSNFVANLHGEASELWEEYRRGTLNSPCDKPVQLTCIEEELADIVIRAMDTAGRMGVDLGNAILKKSEYNRARPYRHGNKLA